MHGFAWLTRQQDQGGALAGAGAHQDKSSCCIKCPSMKALLTSIILPLLSVSAGSQTYTTRAGMVQHFCRASEVTSGPELQRVAAINLRLLPVVVQVPAHQIHFVVVESNIINALC
jgi:hypothetical protein